MNKQTSGIFLIFLLDRDNLNCGEIEKGTIFISFLKSSATNTVPVFILRQNDFVLNSAQGKITNMTTPRRPTICLTLDLFTAKV